VTGADAVPEMAGFTVSAYVPSPMKTVVPGCSFETALVSVQYGVVDVPVPVSLQEVMVLST
jgi:hypothetical protein